MPNNVDRMSLSDRLVNTITDSDYNRYKQKIVVSGLIKKKPQAAFANNANLSVKNL